MTYLELVTKMSNSELLEQRASLRSLIDEVECFSTKDLILRDYVENECQKRGLK